MTHKVTPGACTAPRRQWRYTIFLAALWARLNHQLINPRSMKWGIHDGCQVPRTTNPWHLVVSITSRINHSKTRAKLDPWPIAEDESHYVALCATCFLPTEIRIVYSRVISRKRCPLLTRSLQSPPFCPTWAALLMINKKMAICSVVTITRGTESWVIMGVAIPAWSCEVSLAIPTVINLLSKGVGNWINLLTKIYDVVM